MSGIYSLISIAPKGHNSKNIEAISCDSSVLMKMQKTLQKTHAFSGTTFIIIENTRVLKLQNINNKQNNDNYTNLYKNLNSDLRLVNTQNKYDYQSQLYCITLRENGQYIDCLLDLGTASFNMCAILFQNNISNTPILFDTLYDDGAINS